jgi:hypothetical protein
MAKRRKNSKNGKSKKQLEKNAEDFAEEISALADKIGIKLDEKPIRKHEDWGFRVFGFVGPLIASVFGMVVIMIFAWLAMFTGIVSGMGFFSTFSRFLSSNIYWFFALFLFLGYSDYFSKRFKKTYWVVSPLVSGIGFLFVIWIAIWTLNTINVYTNTVFVGFLSNLLYSNMVNILFIFIILDYVLILIEKTIIFKG